jgi:AraC-like DNA-binding protein
MKQLELWGEKEEAQKVTRSAPPARRTPLCLVGWLHSWRNIYTGETCEQTISELSQSKGILRRVLVDVSRNGVLDFHRYRKGPKLRALVHRQTKGWVHEKRLHKVIQGDAIEWLTVRRVKNGSNSIQRKESIGVAWGKSLLILSLYAQGAGIKTIAKRFGFAPLSVMLLLIEMGVNTSARRNHNKNAGKPLRVLTNQKRLYAASMLTDSGRLKKRAMSRIWSAMKKQSVNARGSFKLVGCSPEELRQHIEKQFEPGMSFENYGEWHVDHIRPCASFDLSKADQMSECFNWRNLQPLWAFENISKGAKHA